MALNYNNVQLAGRLTAKPELKKTPNGTSVCQFTIAVNRKIDNNTADFINCVAWQKTAEFITKYFDKGTAIFVDGSLQVRSWEDTKGQKRYATEVLVSAAYFVNDKATNNSNPLSGATEIEEDEDMPF